MTIDEIIKHYEQVLKELKAYKEQCGDAISRQAVLDAFWKLDVELSPTTIWTIQNMIKDVPSVTPQQRSGRWKFIVYDANRIGHYECSECHWNVLMNVSAYCPHCGTKMEVKE